MAGELGGAPQGNTNATTWTLETAQSLFDDVLETVKNDPKCSSLASATTKIGYYETLLQYLQDKFKNVDFEPIKEAKDIIKARLIQKGLENEYNPTMSIFILKNNHGMQEKVVNENTNINSTPLTQEEIESRRADLEEEY